MKARLKFADGAAIKRELDTQITGILGPKTEADLVKPDKKAKKKVSFICKLGLILVLGRIDSISAAVRAILHSEGQIAGIVSELVGGTHDVRTCATQEKKPAAPAPNGAAPTDGAAAAGSSAAVPVANGDSHAPEANPYAFLPDPRENYRVSSTTSYTDQQIPNTETALLCVPYTALKLQGSIELLAACLCGLALQTYLKQQQPCRS